MSNANNLREQLTSHLLGLISSRTPLEILAHAFLEYGARDAAQDAFGAYDEFLELLDNETARNELEALTAKNASEDATFTRARDIARRFQDGLEKLFFNTDSKLTETVQRYGVF